MDIDFLQLAKNYKDEAVDLLYKVLRYNTVLTKYDPDSDAPFGEGNKECLEFFLNHAQNDGFNVLNCDNYAGHIEYGKGEELLGVLGHLDVVPTPGDWLSDPFTPTLRDGRIYARGAADDKGPVVAAYIGLKIIKDLNLDISKRVRIILGCDEESGSRCLKHYFKKEEMPGFGFSPDAEYPLIYGEKAFQCFKILGTLDKSSVIKSWISGERTNIVPDYTEVVLNGDYKKEFNEFLKANNYEGRIEGDKYITLGKNAHGSIPQNGLNSNYVMASFINIINPCNFTLFLDKYFSFDYDGTKLGIDIDTKQMGHLSLNPGIIRIENGNIFMHVDCRVPSNDHFDIIKRRLEYATKEYDLEYELDEPVFMHYVDPDSNLVQTLYNVYKDISGDTVNKPFTIGGGTYAKFIPNCVAFGPIFPGDEDCIHCPNEYVDIDCFIKNIAIYAKSIYELVK